MSLIDSVPRFDLEAFKQGRLQDLLMVKYLTDLIRLQIGIAQQINTSCYPKGIVETELLKGRVQ